MAVTWVVRAGLIFSLFFVRAYAVDTDGDGINDDKDSCPYDRNNDADGDSICAVDSCRDDPEFNVAIYGLKCQDFRVGNKAFGQCNKYKNLGLGDVCSSCGCACAKEAACDFKIDKCPADKENDIDEDGICGDVDSCPVDKENDADSDGICGNLDSCMIDPQNDVDSDQICGDIDSCPHDSKNDADNDLICGDEDTCPFDVLNDIDSDNLCGDVDSCPMDQENDQDSDNMCGVAQCVDSIDFTSATGYKCAEYALDSEYCKSESTTTLDVCTSCGCACAKEPACGGGRIDICPDDAENDADGDNFCGDVDPCPLDKENDADNDNLCADKDVCPNDASNDVDSDSICGKVDSCPMDRENDADADDICGNEDTCPYDDENDSDNDMICADVDPCPHDFRDPFNGRCNEERLPFCQLNSLQVLREALPAAKLTEACPWSDAEKAAKFGLKSVQCVRAVEVFTMSKAQQTLSGSIAINTGIGWDEDRQRKLANYIAHVARVTPSKLSLSTKSQAPQNGSNQRIGRRGIVVLHVQINVAHLCFRPLLCNDRDGCNFNKDVTGQFINSNKTSAELCACASDSIPIASARATATLSTRSSTASQTTNKVHESTVKLVLKRRPSDTEPLYGSSASVADAFIETDCTSYYLYMGIGIGIGGAVVSTLISVAIVTQVLRVMGYRLRKKTLQAGTRPGITVSIPAASSTSIPAGNGSTGSINKV